MAKKIMIVGMAVAISLPVYADSCALRLKRADSVRAAVTSIEDRIAHLYSEGYLVGQHAPGMHFPKAACVPTCLVNLVQLVRDINGLKPLEQVVEIINDAHAYFGNGKVTFEQLHETLVSWKHEILDGRPVTVFTQRLNESGYEPPSLSDFTAADSIRPLDLVTKNDSLRILIYVDFDSDLQQVGGHAVILVGLRGNRIRFWDPNYPDRTFETQYHIREFHQDGKIVRTLNLSPHANPHPFARLVFAVTTVRAGE